MSDRAEAAEQREEHARQNGPIEVTLPDSGRKLTARRVPIFLMREVQKAVKRPTPPMVEIVYENGRRQEPNRADPDYLEALEEYQMALAEKMIRLVVRRGVEVDIDQAELARLRSDLADLGLPAEADDKYLYIVHICCETDADLRALQDAVLRHSQPTEEATAEAIERFPAEVQAG